jgi:hypothetical protein
MASYLSRVALAMLVMALSPTKDERLLAQPTPTLDQRPLKLPLLRAGERCPTTTGSRDTVPRQAHIFGSGGFWFGSDPVFVGLAWKDSLDDRATFSLGLVPRIGNAPVAKTMRVSEPSYSGPILIRGQALNAEDRALEFDASGRGRSRSLYLMAPNVRSGGPVPRPRGLPRFHRCRRSGIAPRAAALAATRRLDVGLH